MSSRVPEPCDAAVGAHDARAIASGKRRSNPRAYRAAQAAVHKTT